jgi:hypothetical protein
MQRGAKPGVILAMRDAGQNFGTATQLEYRLHALSKVYGGPLFYPLSAEILHFLREFVCRMADRLTPLAASTKMPDGTLAFAVIVCFSGSAAQGEEAIESLRGFGKPMVDLLTERPYLELQSLFDKDIPPGKRYYNKAHNLRHITSGAIDVVLRSTATMLPYPSMIGFQRLHGAGTRVAEDATLSSSLQPSRGLDQFRLRGSGARRRDAPLNLRLLGRLAAVRRSRRVCQRAG